MSPQRRVRRRVGENRERLLEAGLREFGLLGFHGASTSAIATRAGVPQPHVYASFATKQELFLACCDVAADALTGSSRTRPSDAALRFLYQAVAVVDHPQFEPSRPPGAQTRAQLRAQSGGQPPVASQPLSQQQAGLRERLTSLQDSLGEERFDALLVEGARLLLRG